MKGMSEEVIKEGRDCVGWKIQMLLFQEWSDGWGRGECKKMEIGCSKVNVMVQEYRYDKQKFFHDKERHTDTRGRVTECTTHAVLSSM